MSWTTPRTWVAGEVVTAAIMNTHVRDNLLAIGGSWITDGRGAPTIWVAAGTNPVIGNGTLTSRYLQAGKTVDWLVQITSGSSTTYGSGQWMLTFPVAPLNTGGLVNLGMVVDSSGNNRYPLFATVQPLTLNLHALVSTAPTTNVTPTSPYTWASGDGLTALFTYETA